MSPLRRLFLIGTIAVFFTTTAQAQRPQRAPQRDSERQRGSERSPDKLSVGDPAPDFTLKRMDGAEGETLTLSDYQGDRPVALIFGSYT